MAVLEAHNLLKVYGGNNNHTQALKGIDLMVHDGEFVGVMGPSGSGKTTLLNILGGLDEPTSGSVSIHNQRLKEMNKNQLARFRRQHIGYIFQDFNLLDSLSLRENILLPLILEKDTNAEDKADEVIQFFGITDIAHKYPYNVSGGQQQKTAACRALVTNPKIILADEPTGNLDSKSSQTIMQSFEEMNQQKKATIFMVTHDPFAASFCHRIIFIKDGQVNMEIHRKQTQENRKEFFERILDCLAIIGGDNK